MLPVITSASTMDAQPLIAVPADRRVIEPHPFHMTGEKYLRALIDGSGVMPIIVPALEDTFVTGEFLQRVDGVFLTGNYSNIEPHRYDGDPSEDGTLHDPARDAVTLPLARRALDAGIPLLAVCRGFQELNVVLGGTLHQNVAEVAGYHNHVENSSDPLQVQYGPSHPVSLMEGGLLRAIAATDSVMVNSLHSQGVAKLANGVTVEAVADDGLIEAFRVDGAPGFNLAVQWHPEWRAVENPFSLGIFEAFGDACRQHASQRRVVSE